MCWQVDSTSSAVEIVSESAEQMELAKSQVNIVIGNIDLGAIFRHVQLSYSRSGLVDHWWNMSLRLRCRLMLCLA